MTWRNSASQHHKEINMSGKSVVERAIAAYLKAGGPDQPGKGSEEVTIDEVTYAVLRNVKGILAVYRVDGKGYLRRIREVPDSIV